MNKELFKTNLFKILLVAISFIIVAIIIIIVLNANNDKKSPLNLANNIAEIYISQISSIAEFSDAQIEDYYPMQSLDGDTTAYDVKLVNNSGKDNGYILVNLDQNDAPVVFFTSEGPCITEILASQVSNEVAYRIVYLCPTYIVALDEEEKIIASIGEYILKDETIEKYIGEDLATIDFLRLVEDEIDEYISETKDFFIKEWNSLKAGGDTKELLKDTLPDRFSCHFAEGYLRAPSLKQIPPNKGLNDNGFKSGCAATAWAIFTRWHDLLWTPGLLSGSQNVNKDRRWGPENHPNSQEPYNTYNDWITMELSDALFTFNYYPWNDTGYVWTWNISEGFYFMKYSLGGYPSSETRWKNTNTCIRKAYEYITQDKRPALIRTPGHYCVLAGFCVNTQNDKLNKQFVFIKTGWSTPTSGYLRGSYLKDMWYTKSIKTFPDFVWDITDLEQIQDISGVRGVEICSIESLWIDDMLAWPWSVWAFWLSQDGKIYYKTNQLEPFSIRLQPPGVDLIPDNEGILAVSSIYTPDTCVSGAMIFLVYVDAEKKVHLMEWDIKYEYWREIQLPELVTEVRPTVTYNGNWVTIAFANEEGVQKIETRQDLDGINAWPQELGVNEPSKVWNVISYWPGTNKILDLSSETFTKGDIDYTIVSWFQDNDIHFYVSEIGYGAGEWWYTISNVFKHTTGLSLNESQNNMYMTFADEYNRLCVYNLTIKDPASVNTSLPFGWGDFNVHANQSAWLKNATMDTPSMTSYYEDGQYIAWVNENGQIVLESASIDTYTNPIAYSDP